MRIKEKTFKAINRVIILVLVLLGLYVLFIGGIK